MSRTITNINANTETFQIWLNRTNEALDAFEETVTLKSNTAGDTTAGNGFVVGILGANTLTATQIRGGNVASSDYITFVSNTNFATSQVNAVANVYVQGANLTFNSNSTVTAIKVASNGTSTNTTVGGTNLRVTANTRFDTNITLVGDLDVTGTISGDITLTGNSIYTTATIFQSNVEFQDEVTGNVTFDSGTLFIDSVNNRVGVGTSSPSAVIDVVGTSELNGNVTISGANLHVTSTNTSITSNVTLSGVATFSNTVEVTGDATFSNTISVTTVNTANDTTDLTLSTGNTSGPGVILNASGGLVLQSNSTTNAISISSAGGLTIANTLELNGAIDEKVYNLTGTALDPSNGTIQYKTLGGNTTLTDSIAEGESMTLMIDDGSAYTITWPTMTWVNNGGSAPTLATTGYTVVALWKVGSTLYGALVGDGS